MWWKKAKVGDKVVCINDELPANTWHQQHMPKVGQIYSIQEVDLVAYPGGPQLVMVRIDSSSRLWGVGRFRPVEPKSTETGFAIIRKILDRAPVKEDA